MKNQGFTLVELFAVIAILAILFIIALPNVMRILNETKKNSFVTVNVPLKIMMIHLLNK